MKLCAIIPARYMAKRLPKKPLLKIKNKEILLLSYNQVKKVLDPEDIYVFTDNKIVKERLNDKIKNIFIFKGKFKNGTERASAGIIKIKKKYDGAIIVSCDNPFLSREAITKTIKSFKVIKNKKDYFGSTVHVKNDDKKILKDPSIAKVVLNKKSDIIYLSRSAVPHFLIDKKFFYTHHGTVCIKINFLKKYMLLKNSPFQIAEDNEWLKFIENGYKIRSNIIKKMPQEINTKKDLDKYKK